MRGLRLAGPTRLLTGLPCPSPCSAVQKVPVAEKSLVEPVVVFFLIGTTLLLVYVPLAMRSVHKFGWIRTVVIIWIPPLTA